MALSCGLIGLVSAGKTVIFKAVTAARVLNYNASEMNRLVISVPDQRLDRLVEMYHPRKVAPATLEIVDIPGLKVRPQADGNGFRLLGHVKNVEALLHVVRCFEDGNIPFECETIDPVRDVETVDLELMAADSVTLGKRIYSLAKKVRAGDKDAVSETIDCEKVRASIEQGIPARKQSLTVRELANIRDCNLISLKPVLYVGNIQNAGDAANRHVAALKRIADNEHTEMIVFCGKDEADISELPLEEQADFMQELGLNRSSIERLVHAAYRLLGFVTFFTTGEDEVRAWTCHRGDKSPVAAGKIHSDMENGFIRMEVIRYDDLVELGSEEAVAKAGRQRVESREYEVQDGDTVCVLFNKKG